MANQDFDELVLGLVQNASVDHTLSSIDEYLRTMENTNVTQFVIDHFHAFSTLEEWVWLILSSKSPVWINSSQHLQLFRTLGALHRQMIFTTDGMTMDQKATLLMPKCIDPINSIFEYIEETTDDDRYDACYFQIICLWLDNLSDCIHEYSELAGLPLVVQINQLAASKFVMTMQYRQYLHRSKETSLSSKQYFYLKTCSFLLGAFFFYTAEPCNPTANELLEYLGKDYLEVVSFHSQHVQSWQPDLFSCLAHVIAYICACCWCGGVNTERMRILLPTESITHSYIQCLSRILHHQPFHERILKQRTSDETFLIEATLGMTLGSIETLNLAFYIRSETNLIHVLVPLAQNSPFMRISLCAYGILGEILSDEQLKELKITNNICTYFFFMLEQAWQQSTCKNQPIPVSILLRGFLGLCKNDTIQERVAESDKVSLFVDMWDEYPLVMEILWALSFNETIQEKLRANPKLMGKLTKPHQSLMTEQTKKVIDGILWNLTATNSDRPVPDSEDQAIFDIMISYSHKDQPLCRQIYEELVRHGYRVWIDFDQMHGNVMDAMARAIERSHTVLVCMSEQYRRSSYCRAEAHYAFQRQLRIVPVLLQRQYKPDGWLCFLVGQLLYVDFAKYDFNVAMTMLIKELKAPFEKEEANVPRVDEVSLPSHHQPNLPENILDWTVADVHQWLVGHHLTQMSHLLADYDGSSLIYLNRYLTQHESPQMFSLLQEDALRRTTRSLSIVELARFRKLLDDQQQKIPAGAAERPFCQIL